MCRLQISRICMLDVLRSVASHGMMALVSHNHSRTILEEIEGLIRIMEAIVRTRLLIHIKRQKNVQRRKQQFQS